MPTTRQVFILGITPIGVRGPEGEKWQLEEHISELISLTAKLLYPGNNFYVLNWYSLGLSSYIMQNLIQDSFPGVNPEFGEMVIKSKQSQLLPLGTYLRFADHNY